jgi:hypothetical protein
MNIVTARTLQRCRVTQRKEIIMNPINAIVRSALTLGLGCCCVLPLAPALAADSEATIPAVIQAGFDNLQKGQIGPAVNAWRKGGLLAQSSSPSYFNYFTEAQGAVGAYKSYEWITTKAVGRSSRVIYLAINYERGAVYARFLVYRVQDWVVQSMDFNTRPEALMPWLALEQEQ